MSQMSLLKSSVIAVTMLLYSLEARAWSDSNGNSEYSKDNDFNKKPKDIFKEQDFKEHLKNPLIIKDDKLAQKDHFSSDSPLVLPTPSKTQQDYAIHANGSTSPKLFVFDDNMRVAFPKETPLPTPKQSAIHVGGRFVLESVTFGSDVAAGIKQHHNYVENAYPFSWGFEAALHRLQKYIYWNMGAFGQIDWVHKLSEKNKLDGSASCGVFGHIGLSELIHFNQFRIIPAIGAEVNIAWQFKSVDLSVGPSLYVVYQNVYLRVGAYKGLIPETFTLKNNDSDASESMKITKCYGVLSIGIWD
jgi:hypothetical protein